jgi:glycosyltransferase involved in cell wall biosynthesis
VRFLGKTDQALALLKACDIFCLPSRSEGMSNALLEAMVCGRPSVATRVGGTPEVIEDGQNGFLVDNQDDATMAARILALLDDPELARAMGATARGVVEERFSAQRMAAEMAARYDGLLEARRPRRVQQLARQALVKG